MNYKPNIEKLITHELDSANEKFPAFASTHEGYAVLKEEVEELLTEVHCIAAALDFMWGDIKKNTEAKYLIDGSIKFKALAEPERVTVIAHYIKGQDKPIRYVMPSEETKECKDRVSDFVDAVSSGLDHTDPGIVKFFNGVAEKANQTMEILKPGDPLNEIRTAIATNHKRCVVCKFYNWTPVSEHAVCMNPKNQKTETKGTWSCPEWEGTE